MPIVNLMLNPTIVNVGALQIGWGSLLTSAAMLIAAELFLMLGQRRGLPGSSLERIVWWAIPSGIVGARGLHVLQHLAYYRVYPRDALALWHGGLAFDGALVGGLVAAIIVSRRARIPGWIVLDAATPAVLIGLAIGWIGPFLTGADVGRPTGGAWGVIYWHPDALAPPNLLGIPTEPYALYAITWSLVLFGLLSLARSRLSRPGDAVLLASLGFAAGQFLLAFTQPPSVLVWGLSQAQCTALGIAFAAVSAFVMRWHHQPTTVRPAAVHRRTVPEEALRL